LLPLEALHEISHEIHRIFAMQLEQMGLEPRRDQGEAALRADMEALLSADASRYLGAARLAAKLVSVQRLALSTEILGLVRALGLPLQTMPTPPVVHVMGETLKVPGGYYGIGAHQDWPSIQGALDGIVVWAPLVDVDDQRFPVEVIPASHRKGLWAGTPSPTAFDIDPALYRDEDFIRVPARRGDALLFTTFTVHRTALRGSRGFRIAISLRYENATEPTFVERGYPCAYTRTVARGLFVEGFPSPRQVSGAIDGAATGDTVASRPVR
jgi:hypothetical protein